jgi:hypothetical protein
MNNTATQRQWCDNEYGTVGEMRIIMGNQITCRKPSLVPLGPSGIQHDV